MQLKFVFLLVSVSLMLLTTAATKAADAPLSYGDIIRAETDRMKNNYQNEGGQTVIKKQEDDSWLTNTPGTWNYLINKEKLRMRELDTQHKNSH